MNVPLREIIVLLTGSVVAAIVVTVLLAPQDPTVTALAFVVVVGATIAVTYVIGTLSLPAEEAEFTSESNVQRTPSHAAGEDLAAVRWTIREGIGVAIASLFGVLLLALFLMEETALVRSPGLSVGDISVLVLLVVLVFTLGALALWSWRGR